MNGESKNMTQYEHHIPMYFLEWNLLSFVQISLKFVPEGPIDNKSLIV